jgi:hypothetical protein
MGWLVSLHYSDLIAGIHHNALPKASERGSLAHSCKAASEYMRTTEVPLKTVYKSVFKGRVTPLAMVLAGKALYSSFSSEKGTSPANSWLHFFLLVFTRVHHNVLKIYKTTELLEMQLSVRNLFVDQDAHGEATEVGIVDDLQEYSADFGSGLEDMVDPDNNSIGDASSYSEESELV